MDEETFYTVPEAAKKLRVTRAALYKWMKAGRLAYVVVGSERRITGSAIDAFVKAGSDELQKQAYNPKDKSKAPSLAAAFTR